VMKQRSMASGSLLTYTYQGWPTEVESKLKPCIQRKLDLSIEFGCITWGTRVSIPDQLRSHIMNLPHDQHSAASRMKALAPGYVRWLGIDEELERYASTCTVCQRTWKSVPDVSVVP
jgi:hypothetical protein